MAQRRCSICGRSLVHKVPFRGAAWCTDCAQREGDILVINASSEDGKHKCHAELNTMMMSPGKLGRFLKSLNKSFG